MNTQRSEWYPVRCCCDPDKIFGFIRLARIGRVNIVLDRNGGQHEACVKPIAHAARDGLLEPKLYTELAVYSDDRPIEFWRTIIGFVEAQSHVSIRVDEAA